MWGGGSDCAVATKPPCHFNGNVHLTYGSPEYIGNAQLVSAGWDRCVLPVAGLGFMVVAILLLIHFFGSAFLRQNSVFVAVMVPYILSMFVTRDGKHYVSGDLMDRAQAFNYLWEKVTSSPTSAFLSESL